MQKLLAILGIITIAGSGMLGIVGNAPAPAKNEINYLQTNNLKNLNRIKRKTINETNQKNNVNFIKKIDEIPDNSLGAVINNNNDVFWYN